MDSLLQEKTYSGLLYLYTTQSGKEFFGRLRSFLEEFFGNVQFSFLSFSVESETFSLEYSTAVDFHGFETPSVVSQSLLTIARSGEDQRFPLLGRPILDLPGVTLPIASVKMIGIVGPVLGLIVFHDDLALTAGEEVAGLEGFVFDQVSTAYQQVIGRDALAERLEVAEVRLGAIREIGGILGQLDIQVLLSHLIAVFIRLTQAQVGSVILSGGFHEEVEWGLTREVLEKIRERDGQSLVEVAAKDREPLLVRDYGQDPRYEPVADFHIESFLCVPLISKDRVLGTVNLVNPVISRGEVVTATDRTALVTISSLASTAVENALLHRDLLERERIKANLQIARAIQRGMYPVAGPDIPGYEIAWVSRSCEETGGDYFDFLTLGESQAGFAIGDVSGHGIGAALLMATGRANLRALLSVKGDLKEVICRLNDLLANDMDTEKFMTLFMVCLNHRDHGLSFVNAGHDLPLLYRSASGAVQSLPATGIPLGIMAGWPYEIGLADAMNPGDILLMTTDGVWEATNASGERFGKKRLEEGLAGYADRSARGIMDGIISDVEVFSQGIPHPDDVTTVVLKRLG